MPDDFMAARQKVRQEFTDLITRDGKTIDLVRAALLIAAEEYPDIDIEAYLNQLELLAEEVRLLLLHGTEQLYQVPLAASAGMDVLITLNRVLFEQEHFRANRLDYYNPQNSFFNRVMERRLGIPLTLCLLYIGVGKRLGLHIDGIGMPFHLIVRCTFGDETIYIDPYEKGKFLSRKDCQRRLAQIFKNQDDIDPQWLEPLAPKQFLLRLLNNLKHIYLHEKDYERALAICDRILLLNPNLPIERRDRGAIHFQLKHYTRALHDFLIYTELAPEANDLADIRQQIKIIRQIIAMMN